MSKRKDYFKRAQNYYQKDIDGMNEKQLADYIKYQFKNLGIKPPKYLSSKKSIIKNKEKALKRIENQLLKRVKEDSNKKNFLTKKQQQKYNEYNKQIEGNKKLIIDTLKEMGANQLMIDAFLRDNELTFRGTKMFKNLSAFTDRSFESIVMGMVKSGQGKDKYLEELLKNSRIKTNKEYGDDFLEIAQAIAGINGFVLNDNDKKMLLDELKNVNYFGRNLLTRRLFSKLERGYYEQYKEELNITNPDRLIEELQSDIHIYNANAIKMGLSINL